MADRGVCRQCGDTKPLNADGVCEWRHGCEHRQFQHKARTERLLDEMAAVEQVQKNVAFFERWASGGLTEALRRRHPAWPWVTYEPKHNPKQQNNKEHPDADEEG